VTVSFSATDRDVKGPPATSAAIAQSGLPTAKNAPHIDSITIRQGHWAEGILVVREFAFHSPKGNAASIHFEVISTSPSAPDIQNSDRKIQSSAGEQRRGATHIARFNCGAPETAYSIVERATIIGADGEKSNSVDFTIRCPAAQ
jgi:hypothetical protein